MRSINALLAADGTKCKRAKSPTIRVAFEGRIAAFIDRWWDTWR